MFSRWKLIGGLVGSVAAVLLVFGVFTGTGVALSQMSNTNQTSGCSEATSTTGTPATSPTASCYARSPYAAQVVQWARTMADALYVNPTCGSRRGGPDCNDTWYTSSFPQPVIQYGQNWCQAHGGCENWANGSYQCVSFVRGAYSQVYPMTVTNDAFALWEAYQHVPGWQEIPAMATADPAQRGLPQPGDVMVFKDLRVGHVAIVLTVQAPHDGQNGWVTFANANSSSAYDRMPLLPNLTIDTSEWGYSYTVWGYLRPEVNASASVTRISQLDPAQYNSSDEFAAWAYSACSAAAMTEVLDAYGLDLRIHDVLQVESALGYITPQDGLTAEEGIAHTVQHFGFQATWGDHWSLDQVLALADAGTPVIVSWPPDRYAGGHLVVVTGGDSQQVSLADSSSWNRQNLSREQFLQWWAGFGAVVTPAS